jgi:hypothetical protein
LGSTTPAGELDRRLAAVERGLSKRSQTLSLFFNLIMVITAGLAAFYAGSSAKTSEKQFIQLNRPLVLMTPTRFENGEFLALVANGREVRHRVQYELKNVGNVIAVNLQPTPGLTVLDAKTGQRLPVAEEPRVGKRSLGPGDSYMLISELTMSLTSEEAAANYVKQFKDFVEVNMVVMYTHSLDPARSFKTIRRNRIGKSSVIELDSDFRDTLP